MTKSEIKRIKSSINKLNKCGGNCKNCDYMKIKTASEGRNTYYALYCDVDKDIQPYSNSLKTLHTETLEALHFELT